MPEISDYSSKLKELRQKQKISAVKTSEISGISFGRIHAIEQGSEPLWSEACKLCEVYHIDPVNLFGPQEYPDYYVSRPSQDKDEQIEQLKQAIERRDALIDTKDKAIKRLTESLNTAENKIYNAREVLR